MSAISLRLLDLFLGPCEYFVVPGDAAFMRESTESFKRFRIQ
ncbi:Uncharacterised protein [Mycobacteroides abscessus subsp. abscessus]|nr:Uncharacterised protein [Mycobacteroides abscessus subsp. abscessus]